MSSRNENETTTSGAAENKSLVQARKILEKTRNMPKTASSDQTQSMTTSTSNLMCFTASLNEIIAKLEYSKPVFIECVKPNENSFSTQFVSSVVAKQIRELGLIEYARVRKLNYPVKIEFGPFLKRFEKLARMYGISLNSAVNLKEASLRLLQMSGAKNYRVGITKV